MPQAREWTKTADLTILQMRAAGETWANIGQQLGLSRNTIIERGRRLQAASPLRRLPVACEKAVEDPNRDPLPAGHPLTWGLLTDAPYPEVTGK